MIPGSNLSLSLRSPFASFLLLLLCLSSALLEQGCKAPDKPQPSPSSPTSGPTPVPAGPIPPVIPDWSKYPDDWKRCVSPTSRPSKFPAPVDGASLLTSFRNDLPPLGGFLSSHSAALNADVPATIDRLAGGGAWRSKMFDLKKPDGSPKIQPLATPKVLYRWGKRDYEKKMWADSSTGNRPNPTFDPRKINYGAAIAGSGLYLAENFFDSFKYAADAAFSGVGLSEVLVPQGTLFGDFSASGRSSSGERLSTGPTSFDIIFLKSLDLKSWDPPTLGNPADPSSKEYQWAPPPVLFQFFDSSDPTKKKMHNTKDGQNLKREKNNDYGWYVLKTAQGVHINEFTGEESDFSLLGQVKTYIAAHHSGSGDLAKVAQYLEQQTLHTFQERALPRLLADTQVVPLPDTARHEAADWKNQPSLTSIPECQAPNPPPRYHLFTLSGACHTYADPQGQFLVKKYPPAPLPVNQADYRKDPSAYNASYGHCFEELLNLLYDPNAPGGIIRQTGKHFLNAHFPERHSPCWYVQTYKAPDGLLDYIPLFSTNDACHY